MVRTGTVNEDGTLDTSMPFIGTSRGFNDARNYVTYEQDARGNRVTYTLNDDNGLVSKVTSPAPAGANVFDGGNHLQLQRPEPVPAGKRDPRECEQLLWVRFREPPDLHLPQRVQLQLYLRPMGEPAENYDPEPAVVGKPIRGNRTETC